MEGIQVCSNEKASPFPIRDNTSWKKKTEEIHDIYKSSSVT